MYVEQGIVRKEKSIINEICGMHLIMQIVHDLTCSQLIRKPQYIIINVFWCGRFTL